MVLCEKGLGEPFAPGVRRRVVDIYEVTGVKGGRPVGQSLYRWHAEGDTFEQRAEPIGFAQDAIGWARRSAVIAELARSGRTSAADVRQAVAGFRGA